MSGGIAILIRNNLTVEIIKNINIKSGNIEYLGIRITHCNPMINLIVIYRKPHEQKNKRVWREMFEFDRRNCPIIIVGDFNAHDTG